MTRATCILGLAAMLELGVASACLDGGAPGAIRPADSTERVTMGNARVRVEIFSGRENPSWTLSPEDALTVRETLKRLPVAIHSPADPGLGYRGFTVTWEDGARAGVYRNVVEYTEGARTVLYEDAARVVEQRLLADARVHLAPELFKVVESQVQLP